MGWHYPPSAVRMADLGGWHTGADAPVPHEGAVWLDTSVTLAPVLKVWLAGAWRTLSGGEAPAGGLVAELVQTLPGLTQQMQAVAAVPGVGTVGVLDQTLPTLAQAAAAEANRPSTVGALSQALPTLAQQMQATAEAPAGTYLRTFGSDPLGVGLPSDFTSRWVDVPGWRISDTDLGRALHLDEPTATSVSDRVFVSWDTPGDSLGDVEVLVRSLRAATSGLRTAVYVRASGSAGDENGYVLYLDSTTLIRLYRFTDGGTAALLGTAGADIPADDWVWVRVRAEGTALRAKAWADGTAEPAGWAINTTDSVHAAGRIGVGRSRRSTHYFERIGVGIGGAAAPDS